MNYKSRGERIGDWFNYVALAAIATTMLFPFFYIFVVSFSSLTDVLQKDIVLWPDNWVIDAYDYILSSRTFTRSLWVSTYVTVVGTAVNLILTAAMAYGLTRPMLGRSIVLRGVYFLKLAVVLPMGLKNLIFRMLKPASLKSPLMTIQ